MSNVSDFIRTDARSFIINGKRVFLRSGEVHPARVPRGLWRDVLEKAREFGLNTIQSYFFWNVYEKEEGKFDFEGENDIGAYLDLCKEMGLGVLVRPGPYCCGEWNLGALPPWLLAKRGVAFRRLNPVYLRYVDRWLDAFFPFVLPRQIHKGGSVILAQVENELGGGGYGAPGEDLEYLAYLRDGYLRRGVEVPLVTCSGWVEGTIDTINSFEPADSFEAFRKKHPNDPIYSTEFWTGWDDTWFKCTAEVVPRERIERETWRCLAEGAAGYSFFMFHGGTNFENGSQFLQVTSYDDHAPCTEAGAFGEKWFPLSLPTRYTKFFEEILLEGDPGNTARAKGVPKEVEIRCRKHKSGSLWFFRNLGNDLAVFDLSIGGFSAPGFSVPPRSVRPVVEGVGLAEGVRLLGCSGAILARGVADGEPFLVVSSRHPGEQARISIESKKRPVVKGDVEGTWSKGAWTADVDPSKLSAPRWARLECPAVLNLLVVPSDLAARTHEAGGKVCVGPYRLRQVKEGSVAGFREEDSRSWTWTPGKKPARLALPAEARLASLPALKNWRFAQDGPEADASFDDSSWTVMWEPMNRAFLGDTSGYAWYRTAFDWVGSEKLLWKFIAEHADPIAMAGARGKEGNETKTIAFTSLTDRGLIFLNGKLAETTDPPEWSRFVDPFISVRMDLNRGKNVLSVLTDNLGHVKGVWQIRDKTIPGKNFEDDSKGLEGPVSIGWGRDLRLNVWRYRAHLAGQIAGWFDPARGDAAPWQDPSEASPSGWLRWWKTTFRLSKEELAACDCPILVRPTGMKKGWLYLNGRNLGRYWMTGIQEDYYLPKPWLQEENLLVLFEETDATPEKVALVRDPIARVACEVPLP
ncbi:MAG: beta-galactosidase [Planctomycetota bacterium]